MVDHNSQEEQDRVKSWAIRVTDLDERIEAAIAAWRDEHIVPELDDVRWHPLSTEELRTIEASKALAYMTIIYAECAHENRRWEIIEGILECIIGFGLTYEHDALADMLHQCAETFSASLVERRRGREDFKRRVAE
jgi:hypothetical protein